MGDMRQTDQTDQTHRGGPPPGTRVIVDVYADGNPDAVTFTHKWRFEDNSLKGNGTIEVPEKKHAQNGTPITFILNDRTQPKVKLKFVDDDNAIWSNRNFCPEHDPHWDPEITSIRPSEQVLHVVDLNRDRCLIRYNLRFTPDPTKYYYDPEISNGGST